MRLVGHQQECAVSHGVHIPPLTTVEPHAGLLLHVLNLQGKSILFWPITLFASEDGLAASYFVHLGVNHLRHAITDTAQPVLRSGGRDSVQS